MNSPTVSPRAIAPSRPACCPRASSTKSTIRSPSLPATLTCSARSRTKSLTLSPEQVETVPAESGFRAPKLDSSRPHVQIAVGDTGGGVSPENLKQIFEPFFTTKDKGNGIGLAIVTELIGNYHGAVEVQSTVGQGTTFSLYLPLPA